MMTCQFSYVEGEAAMKIVLFNGPPFAGKDRASEALARNIQNRFTHMSFAEPLYRGMLAAFSGTDMGITYQSPHRRFYEGEAKQETRPEFLNYSLRQLLIAMSEGMKQRLDDPHIWTKYAIRQIHLLQERSTAPRLVCFSDCGFQTEPDLLSKEFGERNVWVFQLHRPGKTFAHDSRDYVQHSQVVELHNTFPTFLEWQQYVVKEVEKHLDLQ